MAAAAFIGDQVVIHRFAHVGRHSRDSGVDPCEPAQMSATRTVPAAVPSVRQSSRPLTPSSAVKKSTPPIAQPTTGSLPPWPGRRSATISVPRWVPSLFQSSEPFTPSLAPKKASRSPATVQTDPPGHEEAGPGLMSRTSFVPAREPSDHQSSCPVSPASASKSTPPRRAPTG